ncbi:MAG: hypothetical protein ACK5MT_13310 [Actinomycetales bacterium]
MQSTLAGTTRGGPSAAQLRKSAIAERLSEPHLDPHDAGSGDEAGWALGSLLRTRQDGDPDGVTALVDPESGHDIAGRPRDLHVQKHSAPLVPQFSQVPVGVTSVLAGYRGDH